MTVMAEITHSLATLTMTAAAVLIGWHVADQLFGHVVVTIGIAVMFGFATLVRMIEDFHERFMR